MDTCLILQRSHGIMAEPAAAETATATSSISSSDDEDFSSSSSSSSDEMDDHAATSSPSKKGMHDGGGPLYEMSSLAVQLPFKRGLSKYYQGKSQTFTSLSNVRYLEDLAKPERPLRKKMKPCKSYACFLSPKDSSKSITKKASSSRLGSSSSTSSSSSSSLAAKKHQFVSGRHPIIPAHRSTNFDSTQAQPLLFA